MGSHNTIKRNLNKHLPEIYYENIFFFQTAKKCDSKVKKRYSDALPALEQLDDAASGEGAEDVACDLDDDRLLLLAVVVVLEDDEPGVCLGPRM